MSLFKTRLYFFLFLKLLILAKTCYGESYLSYKIYIGNNKPIAEIGSVYGQKLGFLNQNNNPGGSGNSRSNTETFSISNDFQIGIKSYKTITYNSYLMLDFGLDMALGSTTLFFEDGIGIFVEPIKVSSINVELEPSILLRYKAFSGFSVFGGLSHSLIWTDDTFQAGSWRLKEQLNFGNLYNFLGIQYEIRRLNLSLEAKLLSSKDLTSYSIRLLRKVSLPVNVFK